MVSLDQGEAVKDGEKSVLGFALEIESIRYTDVLDIRKRGNGS